MDFVDSRSPSVPVPAQVRYDPDDGAEYVESVGGYAGHHLRVDGFGWIVAPKHSDFIAPEEALAPAGIESLRLAMLDARRCCSQLPGATEYIRVALEGGADFHATSSAVDEVAVWVEADAVFSVVERRLRRSPQWSSDELQRLLTHAATQHGCRIQRVSITNDGDEFDWEGMGVEPGEAMEMKASFASEPHDLQVRLVADEAKTVGQLIAAGRAALALIDALQGGDLDVDSVRSLVRGGHSNLLIGLAECSWFEAKAHAYGLAGPGDAGERQKIELAQDVARFANGDRDAVVVLGLKEGKDHAIEKVTPVSPNSVNVDQYRAVLDSRIVPPIEGLSVETVDVDDQGLLVMIRGLLHERVTGWVTQPEWLAWS